MSQLVPISTAGVLLDLDTGEQVALAEATDDQIATWIDRIAELQSVAKERRAEAARELLSRMDQSAKWTINAGRFKITAPSPAPDTEWDDAREMCVKLLQLPGLNPQAIFEAVEHVEEWKVRAAGVNALRKLEREDINSILDAHSRKVPKATRNVSVKAA